MILLDTHVVLWLALDPKQLSTRAHKAILSARSAGAGLAISSITLLEIAQLAMRGRVELDIPAKTFLENTEQRFTVFPLNAEIAYLSQRFSAEYPRDPSDRVIGATAQSEGIPLITADDRIRRSAEVKVIW